MENFLTKQVNELKRGVEGSDVVENIRRHYNTEYSFEKGISKVRRLYLEQNIRGSRFDESLQSVIDYIQSSSTVDKEPIVNKLMRLKALPVIDQYDTLKRVGKTTLCVDDALDCDFKKRLCESFRCLLPSNMQSFELRNKDRLTGKTNKHNSLVRRNQTIIEIHEAETICQSQFEVLKNGSKYKVNEIIALLFVSGRRECEILNGRSTFLPIAQKPHHAIFKGVLKKKSSPFEDTDVNDIVIPLLCDFVTFEMAMKRMQSKQANDISTLSNKQISARYCSQLGNAQKKLFPMLSKPHDLRAVYVKYVEQMFTHTLATPLLAMRCLGHDVMEDCLHYMNVSIHNLCRLKESCGQL